MIVKDDDGAVWEGQEERSARLNTGVAGVHSVLSFQCEVCWIRNLEGRDLSPVSDRNYVACIRRANLDAINGRASRTIKNHIDHLKATEERCRDLNRTPNFPQRGPFPLTDPVGMGCAVDMLYRSLVAKGRITNHIQFNTMRKGRSTQTLLWSSSPTGTLEGNALHPGSDSPLAPLSQLGLETSYWVPKIVWAMRPRTRRQSL